MKIGDLIEVRASPSVVQAADVRELRQAHSTLAANYSVLSNSETLHDFVGGYLGFDERARHALDVSIRSLASGQGGATFFNGVFGSDKSHLLGLLALLCDELGHDAFISTHPHLADSLQRMKLKPVGVEPFSVNGVYADNVTAIKPTVALEEVEGVFRAIAEIYPSSSLSNGAGNSNIAYTWTVDDLGIEKEVIIPDAGGNLRDFAAAG